MVNQSKTQSFYLWQTDFVLYCHIGWMGHKNNIQSIITQTPHTVHISSVAVLHSQINFLVHHYFSSQCFTHIQRYLPWDFCHFHACYLTSVCGGLDNSQISLWTVFIGTLLQKSESLWKQMYSTDYPEWQIFLFQCLKLQLWNSIHLNCDSVEADISLTQLEVVK